MQIILTIESQKIDGKPILHFNAYCASQQVTRREADVATFLLKEMKEAFARYEAQTGLKGTVLEDTFVAFPVSLRPEKN